MNNSELIWKLVELLLEAKQNENSSANVQEIKNEKKQKKD